MTPQSAPSMPASAYLGFDRNDYPGDANLKLLRQTFSYAGFWLNQPPGEKTNTWAGKRQALQISRLRISRAVQRQALLAIEDGFECRQAGQVRCPGSRCLGAARRLSARERSSFSTRKKAAGCCRQQKAYIYAWVDGVAAAGFRAGIYCSGIAAKEDGGVSVVTAEDVRQNSAGRKIVYWVANDACPPSPGCAFPKPPPSPAESGIDFAEVWQFAQSPKRRDVAAGCPANYNRDGSCYPPGIDRAPAFACGPEHRGQRRSFPRKGSLTGPADHAFPTADALLLDLPDKKYDFMPDRIVGHGQIDHGDPAGNLKRN